MEAIRRQPFFENNDKQKYFELLPDDHFLKRLYHNLMAMKPGPERIKLEDELTSNMIPGSIDANIMVKVDGKDYHGGGALLGDEFTAAKSALRGYANSSLNSGVVFSAGINPGLYDYISRFQDFYRDKTGQLKKRIILF